MFMAGFFVRVVEMMAETTFAILSTTTQDSKFEIHSSCMRCNAGPLAIATAVKPALF